MPYSTTRIQPDRRFLSPQVEGQFSLRQNRNHVHIVQTKVGVLSCLTRKCQSPSWFPILPSMRYVASSRGCRLGRAIFPVMGVSLLPPKASARHVPLSRKPWLAVGLLELSVLRVGQLVGWSIRRKGASRREAPPGWPLGPQLGPGSHSRNRRSLVDEARGGLPKGLARCRSLGSVGEA
jgi:hypothetical protein